MSHSVLDEIVENRKRLLSETEWISETPQPSSNSMADAIRYSAQGIIFECKRKSPSRGLLAEIYQPDHIAKQYADFAAGISVLTEPDYFAGEDSHLIAVRQAVDLPILAKDFVVDLRQINHARHLGADCILLMLSVVDDDFWRQASQVARELRMAVLTEVHNEQELHRAINLGAEIIGINNRDLHSLKTDLQVSRDLAPQVPEGRIIISESGIGRYQDLKSLAQRVHGFLIGTSMMQSANLSQALRRLIFSEVKICGLTSLADADHAFESGATWGGVIFTPQSKRYLPVTEAGWIAQTSLAMVGVFMNQTLSEIVDATLILPLAAIQLHGDESEQFVAQLRQKLPDHIQIWKTLTVSDSSPDYPSSTEVKETIPQWLTVVDKILIDKPKHRPDDVLDLSPLESMEQLMLAGGIGIDSDILKSRTRHAGLDICSGVESEPRRKNHSLITKLFQQLEVKTRND